MADRIATAIPGREPIELVAFYEKFRDYYPLCELETKRWFVDHVRPDWWIFDVGANVGYYTILFSQLAPQGRVFAFEPTTTAAMLRDNLRHNGVQNAEVHEIALGLKTGEHQDRIYRVWGTEGEVRTYPFYRLDDFVAKHAIQRVDCVKIDVDSFDFEVLRGAERTLLKHSPVIVVELNHALERRQQSVTEALAWLARHGYGKALVLDQYDNFVLRRGADAFRGQAVASSLELLFPPPLRIDERMPASAGEPVAAALVEAASLQHGATARVAARPAGLLLQLLGEARSSEPGAVDFRDIVGQPIETTTVQWDYSLVLSLARFAGTLTLAIGVEVVDGLLGIAVSGDNDSTFSAPERVLKAMPDLQRIVIKVPAPTARSLIFRNAAADDARTTFRVLSVEARRGD
jgi:FkbM family methyltransferase